jgi:twitching motility protein PilJ
VLAAKTMTAEERAQIGFLQNQIDAGLVGIKKNFEKALAFTKNTKVKENWAGRVDVEIREVKDYLSFVNSQTVNAQAIDGDAMQLFSRGTQLTDRLRQLDESVAADLFRLVEARVGRIAGERTFSLILSLLGLVAAGLITYLVTRSITQQTSDITNLIVEIEKGNFDQRIALQSTDELGRTAQAFNNMLDNTKGLMQSRDERDQIQNAIMRLLDQVANVADGDLTAEATVTEDVTGAIADAFNFMIVNLRELIGKVKEVSYQVNVSTNETAQFTERLAQGSQEQAERIAQTSTALTEMSAQIVRVSQTADSSAQVAEQSLQTARKGAEAVSNTVEGMTRIQEQVQETSRRIRQLGERSQEIEEIVRLIEEIADRTGVLALNASIQAAAAGEAGHGFTVVATEVEQLAGRSAEATKRISSLIRAIQSGTNEAIASMEEVKREVINGSRVAHSAGESLHEIEAVSNQLAQLVRSISHATQQQARGSEALSNTMGQLAQLTNQTTTGVMQSALTVKNLAILADDLRTSVASFKVAGNDEGLSLSGALLAKDTQAPSLANAAGLARR